jgi:hypothetical protein
MALTAIEQHRHLVAQQGHLLGQDRHDQQRHTQQRDQQQKLDHQHRQQARNAPAPSRSSRLTRGVSA